MLNEVKHLNDTTLSSIVASVEILPYSQNDTAHSVIQYK
jgi:hypothetical protein